MSVGLTYSPTQSNDVNGSAYCMPYYGLNTVKTKPVVLIKDLPTFDFEFTGQGSLAQEIADQIAINETTHNINQQFESMGYTPKVNYNSTRSIPFIQRSKIIPNPRPNGVVQGYEGMAPKSTNEIGTQVGRATGNSILGRKIGVKTKK